VIHVRKVLHEEWLLPQMVLLMIAFGPVELGEGKNLRIDLPPCLSSFMVSRFQSQPFLLTTVKKHRRPPMVFPKNIQQPFI
jgi:hypothetical protein